VPGSGRQAGTPNKATADMKALAREYGQEVIEGLYTIFTTSESDATRVAAAKEILDRAYGRPPAGRDRRRGRRAGHHHSSRAMVEVNELRPFVPALATSAAGESVRLAAHWVVRDIRTRLISEPGRKQARSDGRCVASDISRVGCPILIFAPQPSSQRGGAGRGLISIGPP
jgi:hypothetical protein